MRSKWKNLIDRYFFAEDSHFNLQVTKFIVCSALLVFSSYPTKLLTEDLTAPYLPIGLFHFLPKIENMELLPIIAGLFRLFLLLAILNIYTRVTLVGASIFGIYNLIYKYNFGVVYHGNWVICMALLLLALVPSAAWKPGYRGIHATWPLRLMQIYLCMVYWSAGFQKLVRSGLEWGWSENLAVRIYHNKMTPLATFLMDSNPLLLRVIATSFLLIEIGAPLALLSAKLRYFFLVSWAMLHIGIQLTFAYHLDFLMNIAVFSAFLPWAHWLSERRFPSVHQRLPGLR